MTLRRSRDVSVRKFIVSHLILIVTLTGLGRAQVNVGSASLSGTVRNTEGKSVESATLRLQLDDQAAAQTRTDAQGNYGFAALTGGAYVLTADAPGYVRTTVPSIFLTRGPKTLDLTLEPEKTPTTPPPSATAPQFFDPPQFTVSGVTDTTSLGGHGPDTVVRARDTIASDTASLNKGLVTPKAAPESAETALRERVSREPDSFAANHDLGKALVERGKQREAIPYLERAAQLNPGSYENAAELESAYAASADDAQDREKIQALLAQHDTAALHHLLADIQEKSGNSLEAVREYQRAAELDPIEPNLFDWGAELLLHHAPEPAAQVFANGHRRFPGSARLLIGMGASAFAIGNDAEAVDRICEASNLNPDNPAPYFFLGKMLRAERTPPDKAVEHLHRFVTLHGDSAEANYYYAVGLWKLQKNAHPPDETLQVESLLKRAIQIDPKFGAAYLQLGIVRAEQKHFPDAISDYQHAIQAAPDLEEAHYRLAQAYRETGQPDKAKAEVQIYQRLAAQSAEQAERERHEIRQFVYTLRDQAPARHP